MVLAAAGLLCLTPLAAAVELLVSAACRSVKEAQPYASISTFAGIGIGMLVVFLPQTVGRWWFLVPIAGQQFMVDLARRGQIPEFMSALLLCIIALAIAATVLIGTTKLLRRDEVVFGS